MTKTPVETWRLRRRFYHAGLLALFCVIALYLGPNRLLFHKWTWVTPADYIPVVRSRCEPVVRAMKAYRAAHGKLPDSSQDIGLSSHDPTSRLARVHWGRIFCGASPNNEV